MDEILDVGDLDRQYCHVQTTVLESSPSECVFSAQTRIAALSALAAGKSGAGAGSELRPRTDAFSIPLTAPKLFKSLLKLSKLF